MLGPAALKRLKTLVKEYNCVTDGEPAARQLEKAYQASLDPNEPLAFREFFDAFHQERRSQEYLGTTVHTLRGFMLSLRMRERYNDLCRKAEYDQGVKDAMQRRGLRPSSGVGYKTLVRKYLCEVLDLSSAGLQKTMDPAQVLSALVSNLGVGILTILPSTFPKKTRQWGYAKVIKAIEVLARLEPLLHPFAGHLEELVYAPFCTGSPISIEAARLKSSRPLLATLRDARTPSVVPETPSVA